MPPLSEDSGSGEVDELLQQESDRYGQPANRRSRSFGRIKSELISENVRSVKGHCVEQ